jgi:myo-inositol-1(or 4)-monophosphatase
MKPLLNIAVKAARSAGNVLVRGMNRVSDLTIESKGRNDFVTEIDRAAEQAVLEVVRKAYPEHGFLGEETGRSGGDEVIWIVDPLDGTTNYLHGFPQFCVSIAAETRGKPTVAVIYDPLRQEMFTAVRGEGAQLEGRKIRVTKRAGLAGALIGTGFPFRNRETWGDLYYDMLKAVSVEAAGIRRPGSAALDLAYVAAGRLDGFWEVGLKPWDTAAGELLIREAGGLISDWHGTERHRELGHMVAGAPKVFKELLKIVAPHAGRLDELLDNGA